MESPSYPFLSCSVQARAVFMFDLANSLEVLHIMLEVKSFSLAPKRYWLLRRWFCWTYDSFHLKSALNSLRHLCNAHQHRNCKSCCCTFVSQHFCLRLLRSFCLSSFLLSLYPRLFSQFPRYTSSIHLLSLTK
jgi:hypothetical protein